MHTPRNSLVFLACAVLTSVALTTPARAQDDREIQVNAYTSGSESSPTIDSLLDGRFLVLWTSSSGPGTDNDQSGIQGRFLTTAGLPTGDQFQVNTITTGRQGGSQIVRMSDGSLVAVWGGEHLAFQRFSATGEPVGTEVVVPSIQGGSSFQLAPGNDGGFLVVWTCFPDCLGGDGSDIVAQLYDASGSPASPAQRVNVFSDGVQDAPEVGSLGDAGFVVSWRGRNLGGTFDPFTFQARRIDRFGNPFGDDLTVSDLVTPIASHSIVGNGSDRFTVVTGPIETNANGLDVQHFDTTGTAVGSVVRIAPGNNLRLRSVGLDLQPTGELDIAVSIYDTAAQTGFDTGFVRLDAAGNVVDEVYRTGTLGTGNEYGPRTARNDTEFVVVWSSETTHGTDTDALSVQARSGFSLIFTDGFESGTTQRWQGDGSRTAATRLHGDQ